MEQPQVAPQEAGHHLLQLHVVTEGQGGGVQRLLEQGQRHQAL